MLAFIALFFPAALMVIWKRKLFDEEYDWKIMGLEYVINVLLLNFIVIGIACLIFGSTGSVVSNLNTYSNFALKYIFLSSVLALVMPWIYIKRDKLKTAYMAVSKISKPNANEETDAIERSDERSGGLLLKISHYKTWILFVLSLLVLFCVGIHKLTNASLWFDETIEYYYSKFLYGTYPGGGDSVSMYERIVSTYQPPLYNIIMFFWLKLSSSEWWFRFFGVLMGVIGGAGIFKAVEKVWNGYAAAVSVLITAFTYRYVYYMQECAEYTILLASLGWLVFAWLCMTELPSVKNIIKYLIVSCIAVYSQYGAAFPVVAFSLIGFLIVLLKKDRKAIRNISVGYGCAILFAGIPLWVFFLSKQMEHQQSSSEHAFTLSKNILIDMYDSLKSVINWNFNDDVWMIVGAALLIYILIFTQRKWIRWLFLSNTLCWFIYYIAVKLSFYSYGSFGSRYNLFFVPIWIASYFCFIGEAVCITQRRFANIGGKNLIAGFFLGIALVYCITGWERVENNWSKEDIRGTVANWYAVEAYEETTLIYYAADSGFSYYATQNSEYDQGTFENVYFMEWARGYTVDEFDAYVDSLFGSKWPEDFYIVASHINEDFNSLLECLTNRGYSAEDIYNSNGGRLIWLSLDSETAQ